MDESLVHYEVEPNYAGWTLAAYVAEKLKRPLPPDRLDRMLRGRSLVHAEPELLPHTLVWPGLKFALRKRSPGDSGEPPPIPVVYEDDALLVVDKPAGLALHPTARYHVTTLTWALQSRHRNAAGEKPDPAHRLDRETSGLVACGRTPFFTRRLKAAFAARQVQKAYLALVEGEPPRDRFEIDHPLQLEGGRIKVKMCVDPAGAPSVTTCEVVRRLRGLSLVRCVPQTGRQHQIRVHLRAAGFPLVGDKLYGPSEEIFLRLAESGGQPAPPGEFDDLIFPDERKLLRLWRQALHASELTLPHPATGEPMSFSSPLPQDVQALIDSL
ncbi:MAG TPA: RluA family pseudouridine synthase [Myxococcales bacterium]|nr:RluA family pseudouridine synthase [Myxococcales bacterium]